MTRPLLDPALIAAQLVADYAKTDPIDALETSEGLLGLQSDNCDIDVSESVYFRLTDAQIEEGNITEERR